MASLLNSLFPQPQMQINPQMKQMIQMIKSAKNPQAAFNSMVQNNPQFKAFVESNKGKTPEQVAKEHGIDLASIMKQL